MRGREREREEVSEGRDREKGKEVTAVRELPEVGQQDYHEYYMQSIEKPFSKHNSSE